MTLSLFYDSAFSPILIYCIYRTHDFVVGADRSCSCCRAVCVRVCVRRTKPGIFEEPEADSPDQLVKMLLTEGQNAALPAGKINR